MLSDSFLLSDLCYDQENDCCSRRCTQEQVTWATCSSANAMEPMENDLEMTDSMSVESLHFSGNLPRRHVLLLKLYELKAGED